MKQYWIVKWGNDFRICYKKVATFKEACLQCYGEIDEKMRFKPIGSSKLSYLTQSNLKAHLESKEGWFKPLRKEKNEILS